MMYNAGNNASGNPIWRLCCEDHYPGPIGWNQNGLTYIESQDAGRLVDELAVCWSGWAITGKPS